VKVPTNTKNSLTKLESPGRANDERPAKKKLHANTGVTRCKPPKSEIVEDPRREIIHPATRNNAAVEKAWLNI
jgi:hypothetical protein